jgi:ABC-2 type transport system permease protein
VLPLLEYSVNEGLDISKLTSYPLTRAELMASLLFSTLLDVPTLGLVLVFGAVVLGWAVSVPLVVLTLLVMFVFYIQVVGMSQLVLALLMRTLQSRRFRDLSIILIALFSSSCYLVQQFVFGGSRFLHFVDNLRAGAYSPYLQWLPPGMAARAIQQAVSGNWGLSFAWLAALLVVSALVLYLWQFILERSLSTPEVGGAVRPRQRIEKAAKSVPGLQVAGASWWERYIPPQVLAITGKELKYFWRDPQLKVLLFQPLIYIGVFIVAPQFNPSTSVGFGRSEWTLLFSPFIVFLSVITLAFNALGMERQGLTMLFLFPVEPRHILWGKNLAVLAIGLGELVLVVLLSAFLAHAWSLLLPTLAMGLAGIAVTLACSNFTSVFFPQRMRQMQRGFRATGAATSQNGCLRTLLSLGMLLVTAIVLLPVIAALLLPIYFHLEGILVASIPLAIIYGGFFLWLVTRLVAPRILAWAPEIIEVVTRE